VGREEADVDEWRSGGSSAPTISSRTPRHSLQRRWIEESPPAGARRFLGAVVRAVQAAHPDPEKAVQAVKGKSKLVKMNIDEHPAIPGQMGISRSRR
jgi:putative thioredoxin